jgi:hypothetical protein
MAHGLNDADTTPSHIINYSLLHSSNQERTVKRLAMMFFGLLLMVSLVSAQEATPEGTPLLVPPAQLDVPAEQMPGAEPVAPAQPLSIAAAEALPVLVAARGDLELLANEVMDSRDVRPTGWSGSIDVTDPSLPLLIRLDLEILAGTVLGPEFRPDGWFGVVASSPLAIARDIRHDLELLADLVVGASTIRPGMWVGDDPLMRCNRATQALLPVLERSGFALSVDFTQPDYCQQIEVQVSRYVETQIIQPPAVAGDAGTGVIEVAGIAQPYVTETPFVVAFFDRNARRRAGVLPVGTGFRPISRSDFEFSNMMLIEGEGFTLFVDYTTTPLSLGEFEALPSSSLGTTTDCNMAWCGD